MWDWLTSTLIGGIVYDLLKAALMAAVGAYVFRAINVLKENKQFWTFAGGLFVFSFIVLTSIPQRPRPNIESSIQQVIAGQADNRDFNAVFSINMINSGQMQSIIKNWLVTASVDGTTYTATNPEIPKDFTFKMPPSNDPDQPLSLTYHGADNIVEKGMVPIQVGSYLTGILLAQFHNVDAQVFHGVVDYTVSFQDVLSRQYVLTKRTTGQIDRIAQIPGIHTDQVCPLRNVSIQVSPVPPLPNGPFSPAKNLLPN